MIARSRAVELIFGSKDVDVVFRQGSSDFALVTFSHLGFNARRTPFWGFSICETDNFTAIGFVAKAYSWFADPSVREAIRLARQKLAATTRVVTYGTSMGGYAALKFSAALGATSALAFSPQISIAPKDVGGFDRRYERHYQPALHDAMAIAEDDVSRDAIIVFDPGVRVDAGHAQAIAQAVPRVKLITARATGHAPIDLFAGSEKISALFGLVNARDFGGIQAHVHALRRGSGLRRQRIIFHMVERRRPALGLRAFEKYRADFPDHRAADLHDAAARAFLRAGDADTAAACVAAAVRLLPKGAGRMVRLSRLLLDLGRMEQALHWAERARAAGPGKAADRLALSAILAELQENGTATRDAS